MLPTLGGRIQTRIILLAVVGGIVTLIIGPLLPISAPLSVVYQNTFVILAAVAVLGIGWEFLYHFLVIDFAVVWLAVWLVANGPMRVPFIRWRFHGGRLV